MRYFDFHTHIIFKQAFDESPNIDSRISKSDIAGIPSMCTDLPNIIQSQIHQSQVAGQGDEVIAGVVLYGMESYLAEEVLPLRQYLKGSSQHKLSRQLLQDVVTNNCKAFTHFTIERLLEPYLAATQSFHVLSRESFNQPLPTNKINIFFVIEGCHSLVDSHNRYVPPNELFPVAEILSNLDKIVARVPVLSVNLTHLQQSNLCNHAFGMQLAKVDPFIPQGNGMEADGHAVVQGLFDRKICVDLKHMSYKSRRELMSAIDNGQYTSVQPLLCTHAGFTGTSFANWPGYMRLKKPVDKAYYVEIVKSMQTRNNPQRPGAPTFNGSSINLFDEEIAWIVRNNGLIGLSMDRRILGYVDKFDEKPTGIDPESDFIVDKEFLSKSEWDSFNIPNSKIGKKIDEGDCLLMFELEENTETDHRSRDEYFFDHILFHIKHFFQVCVNAGIEVNDAQRCLVFGSDFDGLINPFLNLETVADMQTLKNYIRMNLGFYLSSLKDAKKWAKQLDVDQFVENLFYQNGYRFLKSRF